MSILVNWLIAALLFRRRIGEEPIDGMSGDDPEQGAGAAQVEEGAALKREERRPLRSHQPHHPHGQRSEPVDPRLQPARTVPATS